MTALRRVAASMRRAPMFRDRTNAVATAILGILIAYAAVKFVKWGIVNAIWSLPRDAGSQACRAARGEGACWAVVAERFRFILFGAYPFGEHWRPAVACLLFVTLYAASRVRAWWNWRLLGSWIVLPAAAVTLLRGGQLGLSDVPTEFWGGLPLTFVLATVGFVVAFPLAVALALGRRSHLPAIKGLCIVYIEIVRGVPLITFLFMAAVMFPLFVPQGITIDKLLRAQLALVMFVAAYIAEVIRGGLQAIPKAQYEAAASIGLSYWPAGEVRGESGEPAAMPDVAMPVELLDVPAEAIRREGSIAQRCRSHHLLPLGGGEDPIAIADGIPGDQLPDAGHERAARPHGYPVLGDLAVVIAGIAARTAGDIRVVVVNTGCRPAGLNTCSVI
jgi:His/Glu/Gln/Arg/opine family amino acid ABC transporter permease subunit